MQDEHETRDTRSPGESPDFPAPAGAQVRRIAAYAAIARAQARGNIRALLEYCRHWRVIDPPVARQVLGVGRAQAYKVLNRARRLGLIQAVPVSGMPGTPYILTGRGNEAILPFLEADDLEVSPLTELRHLHAPVLQHDLLVQHAVFRVLTDPPAVVRRLYAEAAARQDYGMEDIAQVPVLVYPASFLGAHRWRVAKKIPDAVIEYDPGAVLLGTGGLRLAVECQQTPETRDAVQRVLSCYAEALSAGTGEADGVDAVIYYGTRPRVLQLYAAQWGSTLMPWTYDGQAKRWRRDKMAQDTPWQEWMRDRLVMIADESLEPVYYHSILR